MIIDKEIVAQRILESLDNVEVFPEGALRYAAQVKKELEPHLIAALNNALDDIKDPSIESESDIPFFALFLLGEFCTKAAYPIFLRIFLLSEDELEDLIGDAVTEILPQATAACFDGDMQDLLSLFDNKELYEFARIAALHTVRILLLQGIIGVDQVVSEIESRLKKAINSGNSGDITWLIDFIDDCKLHTLYHMVREAFDLELVDLTFYSREDFEGSCAEEINLNVPWHNFIGSACAELRGWSSFKDLPKLSWRLYFPKIGRNDICFCGSKLKFKNCCSDFVW